MGIKIIEEPDIYLTRAEHERLTQEYTNTIRYMVNPPSFEAWVKRKRDNQIGEMSGLRSVPKEG